jgi:hypothetical protein
MANPDDLTDADRVALVFMFPDGLGGLYQRCDETDPIEQLNAEEAPHNKPQSIGLDQAIT